MPPCRKDRSTYVDVCAVPLRMTYNSAQRTVIDSAKNDSPATLSIFLQQEMFCIDTGFRASADLGETSLYLRSEVHNYAQFYMTSFLAN